jgi:hypothetical protein
MLIAHYATGFAVNRFARRVPLGCLLVASAGLDVAFGLFFAIGIERPGAPAAWSHGLFMATAWALSAALAAGLVGKNARAALVIGAVVLGHWVLDFISHPMGLGKPAPLDLPLLFDGSPLVGLGLYQNPIPAACAELGLFAAGLGVYLHGTRPLGPKGRWGLWAILAGIMLLPVLSAALPLSLAGIVCLAPLGLWPLGNWADRHRGMRIESVAPGAR